MSASSLETESSEVSVIQEADVEEFYNAFCEFKIKDDVDLMEAKNFPKFMRLMGQIVTEAEIIGMLREIHVAHDEQISFDQILTIMHKYFQTPHTPDQIQETFDVFDRGSEGFVTIHEILYIMKNLGMVYPENEVQEMFLQADIDRDGKLRVVDFMRLMRAEKSTNFLEILAKQRRK